MSQCRVALALAVAALLLQLSSAQEMTTVVRGSGPNETASLVLKVLQAVQDRAGKATDFIYRDLPVATSTSTSTGTATAQSDLINNPSKVDFAVGSQPLSNAQWSSFTAGGGVLQIPFALFTVSVYYNVPSTPTLPLNLTACNIAKILTGATTTWSPTLTTSNPGLAITDSTITINMFKDAQYAASTQVLLAFLAAACPGTPAAYTAWTNAVYSTDVGMSVMKTDYAMGYVLTSRGSALNLVEAVVQNANGDYVKASTFNLTNTQAAVAAVLPASYTSDFSAVSVSNLGGVKTFPILAAAYLYVNPNQASTGDKGALLQAMVKFLLTTEAQGYCAAVGLLPIGSTTSSTAAVSSGFTLQTGTTAYTLEAIGTLSATGQDTQSISATRVQDNSYQIAALQAQLATLQAQVTQAGPKLLRGSGSSAVSLVVWRHMDYLTASSTTPIWTSYRGIGSGGGETEIVASPVGSTPLIDFGCSDVPMTQASYNKLASAGVKVVHIPMHIAPISIFFNLPASVLPSGKLYLSACTVAGMFQGSIAMWNDAAIAADNPGLSLPAQAILPAFRATSSGTNAVFSQYFATVCSTWTLGSGKSLPAAGATGTFASNVLAVGSSNDMTTFIKGTPYSIGYADSANGLTVGLTEAYLQNANKKWLTSTTADLTAAASQLFQSGGWPSEPTADFSGVSVLNQPGDKTWPITSIPFMMLRIDMTSKSTSSALLFAFVNYLLSASAQATLPAMGFSPLSSDVVTYTLTRAVPLLNVDTRAPVWYNEPSGGTPYVGAGDAVFSAAKDTYVHTAALQYMAAATAAGTAASSGTSSSTGTSSSINASSLNLTDLAGLTGLGAQIDNQNNKITILESIAVTALIFGMVSMCLAIFVSVKLFVVSATTQRNQVNSSSRAAGELSGRRDSSAPNQIDDMAVSLNPNGPGKV